MCNMFDRSPDPYQLEDYSLPGIFNAFSVHSQIFLVYEGSFLHLKLALVTTDQHNVTSVARHFLCN
jgi:hypothetical protein